jgi:hypothetical protein
VQVRLHYREPKITERLLANSDDRMWACQPTTIRGEQRVMRARARPGREAD